MTQTPTPPDSLSLVKILQDRGFAPLQAEAIVEVVRLSKRDLKPEFFVRSEHFSKYKSEMKNDFQRLEDGVRADIRRLEDRCVTKEDAKHFATKAELAELRADMTRWFLLTILTLAGLISPLLINLFKQSF